MEPLDIKSFTVELKGRYYAARSLLPYFVAGVAVFFAAAFALTSVLLGDPAQSFIVTLFPFIWSMMLLIPMAGFFLFLMRWHGKRGLAVDDNGIAMIAPNGHRIDIPWQHLLAVELRFSKPKLVHCTIVTSLINFSFSNLEVNLDRPVSLKRLYEKGFELENMRGFLYYLNRKAPNVSWRATEPFRRHFKIQYLPYDLEKLK